MQIRISDMLDNASELIEENGEVRNTTNNDRIKKMVFSEIDCTPKNIVKKKGKRNMRKKILKIMKRVGLILLGAAAALIIWNFICRQSAPKYKLHTERLSKCRGIIWWWI